MASKRRTTGIMVALLVSILGAPAAQGAEELEATPEGSHIMTSRPKVWLVSQPRHPSASIIHRLEQGESLRVVDRRRGWLEVVRVLDGDKGFVLRSLVTPAPASLEKYLKAAGDLSLKKAIEVVMAPGSQVWTANVSWVVADPRRPYRTRLRKHRPGQVLEVQARLGAWMRVDDGMGAGYVLVSEIQSTAPNDPTGTSRLIEPVEPMGNRQPHPGPDSAGRMVPSERATRDSHSPPPKPASGSVRPERIGAKPVTSPSAPARPVPGPKQPRERTAHGTSTTVATSAVSVTAPGPVAASPPFSPRPDAEQLAPREPAEGLEATPSQDLVPGGLGVLGLFILSAVVLWLWLRRRRGVEEQSGGAILGRKRLAPGVEVAVVRLGGRVWVLGRGADGDQLLSELDPVVSH